MARATSTFGCLINYNAAGIGLAYLVATIAAALCAASLGITVTRAAIRGLRAEMEIAG